MKDIAVGKLYAVHDIVPHAKHALPGLTPFTDSIGIGENGGFAEYMAVDASQLILVVRTPCVSRYMHSFTLTSIGSPTASPLKWPH